MPSFLLSICRGARVVHSELNIALFWSPVLFLIAIIVAGAMHVSLKIA